VFGLGQLSKRSADDRVEVCSDEQGVLPEPLGHEAGVGGLRVDVQAERAEGGLAAHSLADLQGRGERRLAGRRAVVHGCRDRAGAPADLVQDRAGVAAGSKTVLLADAEAARLAERSGNIDRWNQILLRQAHTRKRLDRR